MKTLIERLQDPEMYVDAIDEAITYIAALERVAGAAVVAHKRLVSYKRYSELVKRKPHYLTPSDVFEKSDSDAFDALDAALREAGKL